MKGFFRRVGARSVRLEKSVARRGAGRHDERVTIPRARIAKPVVVGRPVVRQQARADETAVLQQRS
jgi:hypothetical protein